MGDEAGLGLGLDPGSSFKKAMPHFSYDLNTEQREELWD